MSIGGFFIIICIPVSCIAAPPNRKQGLGDEFGYHNSRYFTKKTWYLQSNYYAEACNY